MQIAQSEPLGTSAVEPEISPSSVVLLEILYNPVCIWTMEVVEA